MIHFDEVLRPAQVKLGIPASQSEDAVRQVMNLLRGDERVPDFAKFEEAVFRREPPLLEEDGCMICIAHGRTEALKQIVMSAGRVDLPEENPEDAAALRLVFVAGIPSAFNTDYLRLVGAIARICSNKEDRNRLLGTKEPGKFVQLLENRLNPS